MCARLFVVDNESFESTRSKMVVGARLPTDINKQWVKTYHDMLADMLQIQIGDYIFLWKNKDGDKKNCIYGVYRAISSPFFEVDPKTQQAEFKIHIEVAYDFSEPISEYEFLNNPYNRNMPWNVVGKKISGKSRASTPLSPDEETALITMLTGLNPDYTYNPPDESRIISVEKPLRISYARHGENPQHFKKFSEIDPLIICSFNEDYRPPFEKVLEAVFNQEMGLKNVQFFEQLGIDVRKVVWFCNYLPYSIEQSEMDYLIMESEDTQAVTRVYVIEFMLGGVDLDHISRSMMYSRWVSETLAMGADVVKPIVISETSPDFINGHGKRKEVMEAGICDIEQQNDLRVSIYTFKFSEKGAQFTKKR